MPDKRGLSKETAEALGSDVWTHAEKCVIKWQFNLYGSFFTALFDAISKADDDNLAKLRFGYPDEVAGFLAWNRAANIFTAFMEASTGNMRGFGGAWGEMALGVLNLIIALAIIPSMRKRRR